MGFNYSLFGSIFFLLLFLNHSCHCYSAKCFKNTLDLNLPIRYIHIRILDENENNITWSIGNLRSEVRGKPEYECRFRHEIVDRFDGIYIFRFKLWSFCDEIEVRLMDPEGSLLCDGPIVIDNPWRLIPENCDCPETDLDSWMTSSNCSTSLESYPQLNHDLSQWSSIDFPKVLQEIEQSWGHERNKFSAALCHYKIIDNEVYRKCYGEYTGFKMFVDSIFTSMARKMHLPDVEFIHNLGDWPLQMIDPHGVPIVSWCGSKSTMDIVLPTYELMESVVKSMEAVTLDVHTALGRQHYPWDAKLNTVVFRGRDSNELRLKIAKLAQTRPDLVSGGITRYFFFDKDKNPPTVNHLPFSDFFKHRYILSVDGTVSAYRFPFLLAGDSLILKSDSEFYEHYYGQLQEGVHYISFNDKNLMSTLEKVQEEDLRHIIKNAKQFVEDHLQPLDLYCYHAMFLREYSKKLKEVSKDVSGMEKVDKSERAKRFGGECKCPKTEDNSHVEL